MIRKKLIKGSAAAKKFMAELRKKKSLGSIRKKKGKVYRPTSKLTKYKLKAIDSKYGKRLVKKANYKVKKSTFKGETHTDNKSHNYKINIDALKKDDIAETVEKLNSLYYEIEKCKEQRKSEKEFSEKLKYQKHINKLTNQRRTLKQYLSTLLK